MNLRKIDSEYIVYIILIGLSSFLFFHTFSFDQKAGFLQEGHVKPGYWPRMILIMILILSTALLFIKIYKSKAFKKETFNHEKPLVATGKLLSLIFICFFYVIIMNYIGFLLGTTFFTFLALLLMNFRKPITLIIFPLFITVIIYLIFIKLLSLLLPRGVGVFYRFSQFFY